jgi:hypothetical protein
MRKLLAILFSAALVFAACGGDDVAEDPQGALDRALDNLGNYEGVSITFTLQSDTDSLRALSADDGDELSEEDAQKIIDSSLALTAKEGDSPEDGQFEMTADVAGHDNAVEIKMVDETFFLRADVRDLFDEFEGDTAQLDQTVQQAGNQPGFEFVGPAVEGEWLALRGLNEVLRQFGGGMQTPSEEDQRTVQRFADTLKENSQVEAGDREGPGGHLIATVPLRQTYQDFAQLLQDLGQLPAGAALPPASEVPDENITLDLWIENDHLRQVEFDITQIGEITDEPAPEGVEQLALRMEIEEFTDDVRAPEDAHEVDAQQIMQQFMGGLPGGGMGEEALPDAPPGGDFCDQLEAELENQPPELRDQLIDQFGDQCPELQN